MRIQQNEATPPMPYPSLESMRLLERTGDAMRNRRPGFAFLVWEYHEWMSENGIILYITADGYDRLCETLEKHFVIFDVYIPFPGKFDKPLGWIAYDLRTGSPDLFYDAHKDIYLARV